MKNDIKMFIAMGVALSGGLAWYVVPRMDAWSAERDFEAARDMDDYDRACRNAGEAAFQWARVGNDRKVSSWQREQDIACLIARSR